MNMKFENSGELRQLLLELHYDLLDTDQSEQLRAAIEQDPVVASEWAKTLQLAGGIAAAAKVNDERCQSEIRRSDSVKADAAQPVNGNVEQATVHSWWFRPSLVAAVAASIMLAVVGSWYWRRVPAAPDARLVIRAESIPSSVPGQQTFRVSTRQLDQMPTRHSVLPIVTANLSFSVLVDNSELYSGSVQTGDDGDAEIELPSELVIPKNARLRVRGTSVGKKLVESNIDIPLEPTRCLTYLKVDRPVYRPGETVYFRSLTLQRRSLEANHAVPIRFELIDPSGVMVPGAFSEGVTDRGVGNGAFTIPSAAPGGPYSIVAKSLDGFFPDEVCKFDVRAYRVPRFKKRIQFDKRSYGPGELVQAEIRVSRAEGGPLSGASLNIQAKIDDRTVHRSSAVTSMEGMATIQFELPDTIRAGVGQLSVSVDDGATRESVTETIPIQLGRVAVEFFPEGGYLVEGVRNRVYFSARNTLGKPIHLEAEIQDRSGRRVAKASTSRDGMGRFAFKPQTGQSYRMKVLAPVDVVESPPLPDTVNDLPVIDTGSGVFDVTEDISLVVRSRQAMPVVLHAVCRGQLVGQRDLELSPGENSVSIPIMDDTAGVIRVTLYEDKDRPQPLVERLVFRRSRRKLSVEIVDQESKLSQSPGESVRLTLQVRDENGEPTPAVLGVAVVDDAALSLDKTDRPDLRTHFLLTSEVESPEDLEHANFYLADDPDASDALDLLLGTQGWRRFVSGDSSQSQTDFQQQLVRLLELDGTTDSDQTVVQNSSRHTDAWLRYRRSVDSAWQRFVRDTKFGSLMVASVWLILIIFSLRRRSRIGLATLLLMTTWCVGCSRSSENRVIAPSGSTDQSAAVEREESASRDAEEAAFAAPNENALPPIGLTSWLMGKLGIQDRIATKYARERGEFGQTEFDPNERLSAAQIRELLKARGIESDALAQQLLDELRFPVRQYAHQHQPNEDGVRDDYTETLCWQPFLMTDSDGRATVRFDLSDSVTTFRVQVDGHGNGRIGSGGGEVISRLPFQIEPKLPLAVTSGDRIDVPLAVINTTDQPTPVSLSWSTDPVLQWDGDAAKRLSLEPDSRLREYVPFTVAPQATTQVAELEFRARGTDDFTDAVRRTIQVQPAGYPDRKSIAGRLTRRQSVDLELPRDVVPGSVQVTVRAYPSPLADTMSGIESILREPHGCFEQTSATNYPNTMALLYLRQAQAVNSDVSQRARGMLDRGYQKLIGFECEQLGYEWFGSDPGHEALSAFGLMQFTDMSEVMPVDPSMLARTRSWLLDRRDGEGGFHRNPRHLHVWSVKQHIVNAYVLWAITEADAAAGQRQRSINDLSIELDQLYRVAEQSDDAYLIGLSAASLANVHRTQQAKRLLEKLADLQDADGGLDGATTVTSSGGQSRKVETTAIAILAFAKVPEFQSQAMAGARWIAAHRLGNAGFGSTQATVLALKALVAVSRHATTKTGGLLQVILGEQTIGQTKLPEDSRTGSTVEIADLGSSIESALEERTATIELVAEQASDLSFTVDLAFHVTRPASDDDCPLALQTQWEGVTKDVKSGDLLKLTSRVKNTSSDGLPMTVAVIGLPGGVEPRSKELDELKEKGLFDYYEIRRREVVFYWRQLHPGEEKEIGIHVNAVLPGSYTAPASRSYLYYTAEQKVWEDPLQIEIGR